MEEFNLYIIDHCKCGKEINYKKNGNDDFIQKVFNKDVLESTLLIQWGYTSYKIPAIIDNLLALLLKEYKKTKAIKIKEFYIRRILRIWPLYYLYILLQNCLLYSLLIVHL